MKTDNDIVDVVGGYTQRDDKLTFRLRNGELITVQDYILQVIAEQIKKHLETKE